MSDLHYLAAVDALRLFRSRELSPVELMHAVITRSEAVEPTVNALCVTYFEEALAAARAAEDSYMGRGRAPGPLSGIPVAIKDTVPVAGQQCSCGSLAHKDDIAVESSVIVERIQEAGGIVHARTTSPEFACAGFTQSQLWGVTRNPWNPEYSVGGSSGGAGAALACGTAMLASGGDLLGSVRIPASANGVVGFKPTFGRVPQDPPYNLDQYCHTGPLARTVADCALFQNVMSGPDLRDTVCVAPKVEIPLRHEGIESMRMALVVAPDDWPIDPDVAAATRAAADVFREVGAHVEETDLALDQQQVLQATYVHVGAIFGAIIAEEVAEHGDVLNSYTVAMVEKATSALRRIGFARGLAMEAEIAARIVGALGDHDFLLMPTMLTRGLVAGDDYVGHGLLVGNKDVSDYFGAFLTPLFNVASRFPVLNVPSGFADNGVPTGLQIVGRPYDDVSVFRAGTLYESSRPWLSTPHQRPLQTVRQGAL